MAEDKGDRKGDGKPSSAGAEAASAHAEERKLKPEIEPEREDVVTTRRQVMKLCTVALGVAAVGAAAVPAALAAVYPAGRRTVRAPEGGIDAGALADLPSDQPVRVDLVAADATDAWLHKTAAPLGAVYLMKGADGQPKCLSSVCPHLGCFVEWEAEKKHFACPCHNSAFDMAGAHTAGPSPRGMDPLEVEVVDGRVKVRWARFVTNTPGRTKV